MSQPREKQGEEEPLHRKVFRDWQGVVTSASRNALPEKAFYQLENLQPIGPANIHTVNDISAALHDYAGDEVYWAQQLNISGTDYVISFANNGKVFAYNIGAAINTQINGGGTLLSGSSSRMTQWKNQILLIIDSSGYYYWDGTTFAKLTGTGVPSAGTDIAVAFGRVWIVNGRLLSFSGADGFGGGAPTIPDATNYWLPANGAGFDILTDPVLLSNVTRLYASDGYLFIFGVSSINVISDVYVPTDSTGAPVSPPTPLFTNLNIQAALGTDQPGSVYSINRELTFANKTGIWVVQGVQAARISADIDGTWQYADFSQPIFGGVVSVNNIQTRAMLMKRLNDPIFGSNTILLMYWDNKWWSANFGALNILVPVTTDGVQQLYGFIANKLYKLFARTDQSPVWKFMTALWPMEDPIEDKQVIRAGFEASIQSISSAFSLTVDSPNSSAAVPNLGATGLISWINNSGQTVQWQNNALATVVWFSGQFLIFNGSAPGTWQKYVGLTGTGQAQMELSGCYMDYKLKAAW